MCALLNFIKVFCIVLHILTFHSLRSCIYPPPPQVHMRGVTTQEKYNAAALINWLIAVMGKMAFGLWLCASIAVFTEERTSFLKIYICKTLIRIDHRYKFMEILWENTL